MPSRVIVALAVIFMLHPAVGSYYYDFDLRLNFKKPSVDRAQTLALNNILDLEKTK